MTKSLTLQEFLLRVANDFSLSFFSVADIVSAIENAQRGHMTILTPATAFTKKEVKTINPVLGRNAVRDQRVYHVEGGDIVWGLYGEFNAYGMHISRGGIASIAFAPIQYATDK